MEYEGNFQESWQLYGYLQLHEHFNQYQEEERKCRERLSARWNEMKTEIDQGQEKLKAYIKALDDLSWGDSTNDSYGFNERVRISLAGSVYEVKRAALVQDPAIGWNLLSCLFKKRWEKFLLHDKNGRIYFDCEAEWMKPIIQALKGEVDVALDKSVNNLSAWHSILCRFQIQDSIKFNVAKAYTQQHYSQSRNKSQACRSDKTRTNDDIYSVIINRTKTKEKKITPLFGMTRASSQFLQDTNSVLQDQLSLLNQSAQLLSEAENVYVEVQDNTRIFLKELRFMQHYLYSEWKDIIPSLPEFQAIGSRETEIERHIQYFATIFPMIQEYNHRVQSAFTATERRHQDSLAYFNVDGEIMAIKKSTISSLFSGSQLAVRLSGRWTEQSDDIDEEGNIYYDVSLAAFRALLQFARMRVLAKDASFIFEAEIKARLKSLIDYFSINSETIDFQEVKCQQTHAVADINDY